MGTDVGHKDRTRINLLSLRLHFSEFYLVNFYFLQVFLFKKFINTIHPPLVFVLLEYRSYTWYQSKDALHHNSKKYILHNVHSYLTDPTTTIESVE